MLLQEKHSHNSSQPKIIIKLGFLLSLQCQLFFWFCILTKSAEIDDGVLKKKCKINTQVRRRLLTTNKLSAIQFTLLIRQDPSPRTKIDRKAPVKQFVPSSKSWAGKDIFLSLTQIMLTILILQDWRSRPSRAKKKLIFSFFRKIISHKKKKVIYCK